jgi:hypothetical protein
LGVGGLVRHLRSRTHGFGRVDLGIRGSDGLASAVSLASVCRRREGKCHCARSEKRREESFTKHGIFLWKANAFHKRTQNVA